MVDVISLIVTSPVLSFTSYVVVIFLSPSSPSLSVKTLLPTGRVASFIYLIRELIVSVTTVGFVPTLITSV